MVNRIPHNMTTDINHIPADRTIDSLEMIARGLRQIKKAKSTWRKYIKAEKEGRVTAEQIAAAKAVLRESISDTLEAVMSRGLYVGQGDECDYRTRAEANAQEIIS